VSKTLHTVTVRGNGHRWGINTYITKETASDWRADGLEVEEILNVIPVWIVDLGLVRPWCFLQDLFNFRNPFKP
jgi:hypothetical protein